MQLDPISRPDPDPDALPRRVPSIWFSRLEDALASGDFEAALEADRELRRLGVHVRFPAIRPKSEGARHE
jgi:hypothetical protein